MLRSAISAGYQVAATYSIIFTDPAKMASAENRLRYLAPATSTGNRPPAASQRVWCHTDAVMWMAAARHTTGPRVAEWPLLEWARVATPA